jgi:amidase
MVPLALGSQTVGSTLRPAAYCGIVGMKATYGRVSCTGVIPLAWSFDTVGIFGRRVADVALTLEVLAGYDPSDPASVDRPAPAAVSPLVRPPRLAVPRQLVETATRETAAHLDVIADRCRQAGASLHEVPLPVSFEGLEDAGQRVVQSEAAAFHADRYPVHAEQYREKFRATLAAGMKVTTVEYVHALRHCRRFRRECEGWLQAFDALLMPTAPAPAPRGLESTGDASFCSPWSYAGLPAIALPSGVAANGLPLGIQLVAAPWREAELLATAGWVEQLLAFDGVPGIVA